MFLFFENLQNFLHLTIKYTSKESCFNYIFSFLSNVNFKFAVDRDFFHARILYVVLQCFVNSIKKNMNDMIFYPSVFNYKSEHKL